MSSSSDSALKAFVDLVINIPREYDEFGRPDGVPIHRAAVDAGLPLITDLQLARAVIEALRRKKPEDLAIRAWDEYVRQAPSRQARPQT